MTKMEQRIFRDGNNFYRVQIRFLPVNEWEQNDGWMTTYITQVLANAKKRLIPNVPFINILETTKQILNIK